MFGRYRSLPRWLNAQNLAALLSVSANLFYVFPSIFERFQQHSKFHCLTLGHLSRFSGQGSNIFEALPLRSDMIALLQAPDQGVRIDENT